MQYGCTEEDFLVYSELTIATQQETKVIGAPTVPHQVQILDFRGKVQRIPDQRGLRWLQSFKVCTEGVDQAQFSSESIQRFKHPHTAKICKHLQLFSSCQSPIAELTRPSSPSHRPHVCSVSGISQNVSIDCSILCTVSHKNRHVDIYVRIGIK